MSAVLWFKTSERLYRFLCFAWLGCCGGFALNGFVGGASYIYHVEPGATFGFLTSLMFAEILALITKVPFRSKVFVTINFLGAALSVAFDLLGAPPGLMALPGMFVAALPVLIIAPTVLFRHRDRLTFVSGSFAGASFFWGLHLLDFAYAIDKPQYMFAGFTLALVLSLALSTLATAAILESITNENTRVQLEAKYGALIANSAKLAALGEMAGGVAHEINSPLAIIKMLSVRIHYKLTEMTVSDPQVLGMVTSVDTAVDRIARIVKGLLAFSRDGSRDPMVTEEVSKIIEDTLSLCREKFIDGGIQLSVELTNPTLKIRCRPIEISQILLNLLNNAKDAVLESEIKSVRVVARAQPGNVEISVIDSGLGISDAIRDKIFQPFFTTKQIGKGTGLGLSISKGIAESHGGTLSLGTDRAHCQFILTLPLLPK